MKYCNVSAGLLAVVFLTLGAWSEAFAGTLALDGAYGEGMVLQRNRPIRLAGTAKPGARVAVAFADAKAVEVTAGEDGRFLAELPARGPGGPYALTLSSGDETLAFRDVLVGDVWICSGQSNMEFYMVGPKWKYFYLPDGDAIAAAAKDRRLRLINVLHEVSPGKRRRNVPGNPTWCAGDDAVAIRNFSAVGYLFGTQLRAALGEGVPVGLIDASWGGTPIEAWIPLEGYSYSKETEARAAGARAALTPTAEAKAQAEAVRRAIEVHLQKEMADWLKRFLASAPDVSRIALAEWMKPDAPLAGWTMQKPGETTLASSGIAWQRYEVEVPAAWVGQACELHFDFVNDADETWFDGVKAGATDYRTEKYWKCPRDYRVTPKHAGKTVVAVRAMNYYGRLSFGTKMYLKNLATGEQVPFGADGRFERVEFVADLSVTGVRPSALKIDSSVDLESNYFPGTLFNAMIAPFVEMNVAGVIWYQGCNNAGEPEAYRHLERAQIVAWRKEFRDPKLPFLVTQLSAFQEHRPKDRLPDDFWKALSPAQCIGYGPIRAAQQELLDFPQAGVACTIDVGDHSDIHPADKKTVARRLAHEALRVAYGRAEYAPGPRGISARREGNSVVVTVRDSGAGIIFRGGKANPHLFAVAGKAGPFAWAEAEMRADGTIRVWSEAVPEPTRVQYAYQGYPPAPNAYRKDDGLPLFPFSLVCADDLPAAAHTEPRVYENASVGRLLYRWAAPKTPQSGVRYPLVVLLHGAGERGDDNVSQLVHGAMPLFDYMAEKKIDAYFIAGQVPEGELWANIPWGSTEHRMPAKPTRSMALLLELIDKTVADGLVDPSRIYITGLSMGGYGTWDAIERRPDLFAAAMPVCGGGDALGAWKIRTLPVWCWHGRKDGVVPCAQSRRMTSALWSVDGDVRYTEVPGRGHDVWTDAYRPAAFDWLFAQRRRVVPAPSF